LAFDKPMPGRMSLVQRAIGKSDVTTGCQSTETSIQCAAAGSGFFWLVFENNGTYIQKTVLDAKVTVRYQSQPIWQSIHTALDSMRHNPLYSFYWRASDVTTDLDFVAQIRKNIGYAKDAESFCDDYNLGTCQ
jgi:hypothetical protein